MPQKIERLWRIFATGFCFSMFGLGGVLIPVVFFSVIHLVSGNRDCGNRRCQYVVHLSFRSFVWLMNAVGVITYKLEGAENLDDIRGHLIVANHPSLLDVVLLIAQLPQAYCVVKKAAWSNPFLAGMMWGTGYIQNQDPSQLIQLCSARLEQGGNLLIFPEATRTVPGKPIKLKRGAASVIVDSGKPFLPVKITCEPQMLSKTQKWYDIPSSPGHFTITIDKTIDPCGLLVDGDMLSKANRRINKMLEIFWGGRATV
jgi:1-acyl-sn-glycerol-3-phosphate acyltransferase